MLPKDEAVEKVVVFMDLYSINMEDFDTIVEISKFKGYPNPLDGIQPAVKAALTRAYNKGSSSRVIRTADLITLPGVKKAPKKRVAAMLEPVTEPAPEENGEGFSVDEEASLSDNEEQEDSADAEQKLQTDLASLSSKGIQVQMDLKSPGSSSGKRAPAGRAKGSSPATDKKGGGRGSGSGSRKKK